MILKFFLASFFSVDSIRILLSELGLLDPTIPKWNLFLKGFAPL